MRAFIDIFEFLFIGTAVFILTFIFIAQPLEITGDSMVPTFHNQEQIIAEKLSVKFEELERGEIVIIKHPETEGVLLIKRIVGMPNEEIKIENGEIYINGEVLVEPYLGNNVQTAGKKALEEGQIYLIPMDTYVVMGDNRESSTDSRYWGPVHKSDVVGRGFLVYYPFENIRMIGNWKL